MIIIKFYQCINLYTTISSSCLKNSFLLIFLLSIIFYKYILTTSSLVPFFPRNLVLLNTSIYSPYDLPLEKHPPFATSSHILIIIINNNKIHTALTTYHKLFSTF